MNTRNISIDLILPERPILICDSPNQLAPKEKKVQGKLNITSTKPVKISQIIICYKVETHLDYKDDSIPNGIFSQNRMTASKTLRKKKQRLLKQALLLPIGTTDICFDVFIPSHMYPSLQSRYCQIRHLVSAKLILPMKMISNVLMIKKSILVKKSSVPKEISMCIIPIPRLLMTGERPDLIGWKFQVPMWVCLQTNVEFQGTFHASRTVTLNKIQIDVLQEELYYYDVACTDVKRRLVTNINLPSTYIEPPLNSDISFSFPLFDDRNEVIGTLDSPFSRIRHFIRVIVSIDCTSICIGLPIQVTPHVSLECEYVSDQFLNVLPTYQSVIVQGDRLPKYTTHKGKGSTTFSATAEIMPAGERSMEEFCAITL